jgi:hypothetical protein
MAHTTARRGLRVPDLGDNPDIPRDVGNLGADIDSAMAGLYTVLNFADLPTNGTTPRARDGDLGWVTSDTTMGPNGTLYKWDNANNLWRLAGHVNDPVPTQAGARTLGSGAQQAAAGNDSRLSDARTPLAHAASHLSGGSDSLINYFLQLFTTGSHKIKWGANVIDGGGFGSVNVATRAIAHGMGAAPTLVLAWCTTGVSTADSEDPIICSSLGWDATNFTIRIRTASGGTINFPGISCYWIAIS